MTIVRAAGIAALLGLAACAAAAPEARQVSLPSAPAVTESQPASDREHQRIVATYGGLYIDPRLETRLTDIVDKLVATSERPDLKYRVVILNSPSVNAFSLPSGQLYVTRGLLALANDSSEIASVLAHEMAHVIARHAAIREQQARQSAMMASVINDVLGDAQVGALALAKSKLALASFSRQQEFEADGIGVGIAARAGYDPFGAVRYLTNMERNATIKADKSAPDRNFVEFLATHPTTPDRIRNAQTNARQFGGPGTGTSDRASFMPALDGLIYGEDPNEGYVRGRRFLHAKLGFTFTAPPGFTMENTAEAVLGIRDGGGQAMRLDVVRVPAEQSLADYLTSGWMDKVSADSVRNFTVNGFPAASATAGGDDWSFRIYAIRFGSEVYRYIFAAKQITPEAERSFREAVGTFRRMTLAEIHGAKPLRIKVVYASAGDTIDTMANRMMVADHKRERFLALNGLPAGHRFGAREAVKIVVE